MTHKVLSMLQPWASALVCGDKMVETRSFNTKYRGTLLIHASKGFKKEQELVLLDLIRHNLLSFVRPTEDPRQHILEMPKGVIIGKVDVIDTFQFGSDKAIQFLREMEEDARIREVSLGDWNEGRWGWVTENPVMFKNPIPAKGNLGLWNWEGEIPDLK